MRGASAMERCAWNRWLQSGLFFFSSRRRHTRFDCDWSSDVCSSDLQPLSGTYDKYTRLFEELSDAAPNEHVTFSFADRKSTRLNSSHSQISYAVFCLKKKNRKIMAARILGDVTDSRASRTLPPSTGR